MDIRPEDREKADGLSDLIEIGAYRKACSLDGRLDKILDEWDKSPGYQSHKHYRDFFGLGMIIFGMIFGVTIGCVISILLWPVGL